jgi:ubiquinone biosynthesis protein UbiJ
MCTYVLLLDAERRRLGEQLQEADPVSPPSGERAEMAEEVDALRLAVAALHEQGLADPAGGC